MAKWHWGIGVGVGPVWIARSMRVGRPGKSSMALPMIVSVVYIGVYYFHWWFAVLMLILLLGATGLSKRIRETISGRKGD